MVCVLFVFVCLFVGVCCCVLWGVCSRGQHTSDSVCACRNASEWDGAVLLECTFGVVDDVVLCACCCVLCSILIVTCICLVAIVLLSCAVFGMLECLLMHGGSLRTYVWFVDASNRSACFVPASRASTSVPGFLSGHLGPSAR